MYSKYSTSFIHPFIHFLPQKDGYTLDRSAVAAGLTDSQTNIHTYGQFIIAS